MGKYHGNGGLGRVGEGLMGTHQFWQTLGRVKVFLLLICQSEVIDDRLAWYRSPTPDDQIDGNRYGTTELCKLRAMTSLRWPADGALDWRRPRHVPDVEDGAVQSGSPIKRCRHELSWRFIRIFDWSRHPFVVKTLKTWHIYGQIYQNDTVMSLGNDGHVIATMNEHVIPTGVQLGCGSMTSLAEELFSVTSYYINAWFQLVKLFIISHIWPFSLFFILSCL